MHHHTGSMYMLKCTLQSAIISKGNRIEISGGDIIFVRMASDVGFETLRLLNEYTNLKRLIDAHKKRNPSVPYSEPLLGPVCVSNHNLALHFHPGGRFSKRGSQYNKQTSYRLNRNASLPVKSACDKAESSFAPTRAATVWHNLSSNESRPLPTSQKTFSKFESSGGHTQLKASLPPKIVPLEISTLHNSRFKLQKIAHDLPASNMTVAQHIVKTNSGSCKLPQQKISDLLKNNSQFSLPVVFKTPETKNNDSHTKASVPSKYAPQVRSKIHSSRFKLQKIVDSSLSAPNVATAQFSEKLSERPHNLSSLKLLCSKTVKLQPPIQRSLMKYENTSSTSQYQTKLISPIKGVASVVCRDYNSGLMSQRIRQSFAMVSEAASSPGMKAQKKMQSKYKLVHQEKNGLRQTPNSVRKRIAAKQASLTSKYSWASKKLVPTVTSSQGRCVLRLATLMNEPISNSAGGTLLPFKSKYAISKCGSLKTSPKLVRHVNKYSVKYLPQKSRDKTAQFIGRFKASARSSKLQQCSPKRLMQNAVTVKSKSCNPLKGKSELILIGGILYKSSKTKLSRTGHVKPFQAATSSSAPLKKSSNAGMKKQCIVTVRGIKFVMDQNRMVLKRLPVQEAKCTNVTRSTSNVASKISRNLTRIDIGGETYIQTRPGVLLRSSTSQLRTLANRVLNRSILRSKVSKHKSEQFCMFYNKFGKCNNKDKGICRYIHDPEKIAICKRYLHGECKVENCPFSHEICRSKMPVCTFFLHGRCSSDSCNYRHVNVNPNADICLDFAKGYCPLGDECKKWHVTTCPQFEQFGNCDRGEKCPLNHKRKRPVKPCATSSEIPPVLTSSTNKRPLEFQDGLEEHPTKRLPSFISILDDSLISEDHEMQNTGVGDPLQIKPDFLKHH